MDNEQLFRTLQTLVESWCDRRSLRALRYILRAYPMVSNLTDSWGELMIALQDVRAFASNQITPEELDTVNECIRSIEKRVYRR